MVEPHQGLRAMKYLALSGSTREGSMNQKTVDVVAASLRILPADVTVITVSYTHLTLPTTPYV